MNQKLPLVSVIIPAYNNENSIESAICSATNQTYSNLEIIVVNDGSGDNTLSIINRCALNEERLICIDQQNKGTNIARKIGLDASSGKYVQYLDGDDTLLPYAIELLVKCAEESNADIVSAPFIFCFEDGRKTTSPILTEDVILGTEYFRKIFNWEGATWNMWANFQKRSLVYDYNIEILSDIPYGEDATWMIQIFVNDPKIVSLKEPIINYNQNPLSVSYNKKARAKREKGTRALYHWFEEFINQMGVEKEFDKELALLHINMTFTCINASRFKNVGRDMKELNTNIALYPELTNSLSGTELIFIKAFQRCSALGYLRLIHHTIKSKNEYR